MSGAVERDPFEISQLPETIVGFQQSRAQRGAADALVGADRDQAERMLLLVFDDKETPVRQLLDGGWFIDAGQGLERGHVVHAVIVSCTDCFGYPVFGQSTLSDRSGMCAKCQDYGVR